ncbi:MAG: radical SAM protein [Phycisphaeraceae bacterium]|nr:radical SAM protein [Phycisphaeraceae bacterium]
MPAPPPSTAPVDSRPPRVAPPEHPDASALDEGLLRAVVAGQARLTPEQALDLFHNMPLATLGRWADARCRVLHGDLFRTYVIDRNINYTNVCTAKCTFCAFRRDAGDHDAYTLSHEQIHEKIEQLAAIGGTQILMQGGMNPDLPLDYYLDLLASIKQRFPHIHIHAFSPPELVEFVNFFNPPGATYFDKARWVLARLQEAGLDSLPGGGGEIFAHHVRRRIGLGKCDATAWLTSMYAAHSLGMHTSATMMFGHIEGHADRIHHMWLVRRWQDAALGRSDAATQRRSDEGEGPESMPHLDAPHSVASSLRRSVVPGHYTAFIAWPFQRENTPLGRVKDWGFRPEDTGEFPGDACADVRGHGDPSRHREFGRRVRMSGSSDYLRTQAISRLMLDNIYSIGASWVTMGPHVGQVGLMFGASDMGSVMMEENVVSSAGTTYCLDEAVLCRLIRDAGFVPAQRNNTYDIVRVHAGAESPDRRVADWSEHRARRLHAQSAAAAATPAESAPAELTVSIRVPDAATA